MLHLGEAASPECTGCWWHGKPNAAVSVEVVADLSKPEGKTHTVQESTEQGRVRRDSVYRGSQSGGGR